jgi:predicted RNase H-like nuclease/NTP pyrophosphatase (non-canonical NTP hydrolase)
VTASVPSPRYVAGVDGCRAGWLVVLEDLDTGRYSARVVDQGFGAVLSLPEAPATIAVDIPIGLLDVAAAGGRDCEVLARQRLGPRTSSVFSSPTRAALAALRSDKTYREVVDANRAGVVGAPGISQQAFAILPKMGEVDDVLTPELQAIVREIHPELCFAAAAGTPMAHGKKSADGQSERIAVLESVGFTRPHELLGARLPRGVKIDDLLDACIACWTARRISEGRAERLPASPPTDARGLRMELWVPIAEARPSPADRLSALTADLRAFVAEREWSKFHDPKNLSMLVASEAGELAAVLRWVDNKDADAAASTGSTRQKLAAEIADVAIAVLLLCDRLNLDLVDSVRAKLAVNRANYPVELSRGHAVRPPREPET